MLGKMTHTNGSNCTINPSMNGCDDETDEQEEKNKDAHYQLLHHKHGTHYVSADWGPIHKKS